MNTHKFKLISGPLCEVKEFTAKQQRLLTETNSTSNKSLRNASRMDIFLASIIVAVGSERLEFWGEDKKVDFVKSMLGFDKAQILVEARQFSMDFEPNFRFSYKWVDDSGDKQEEVIDYLLPTDGDSFPIKPMRVEIGGEVQQADFEEYEQVLAHSEVFITLPRSKQEIRFNMLDGIGEAMARGLKASDRNINTPLEMRRPVHFVGGVPVKLKIDDMSFKDVEFLRKTIQEREGNIDTKIMFPHPDAENRATEDKNVEMDILNITAFFFSSEAL